MSTGICFSLYSFLCLSISLSLSVSPSLSRYKQLESELESSLKRCVEIKEEKMAAVEARLQESSSLNHQLRQELRSVSLTPADTHQSDIHFIVNDTCVYEDIVSVLVKQVVKHAVKT